MQSARFNALASIPAFVCILIGASAPAGIIHVPDDYPTIQAGIDAASNGDVVEIADGTYTGDGNRDLDLGGKAITVRSASGPDNCTIDCEGSEIEPHIGFYFTSGEDPDSVLEGVTIINGYLDFDAPIAIAVSNSNPTIKNNVFVGNGIEFGGNVSDAQVLGNMFRDFDFEPFGEAIRISGTGTSIKTVTIRANTFQDFSGFDFFAISVGGTGDASNTGIIEDNAFRRFSSDSPFSGAVEVSERDRRSWRDDLWLPVEQRVHCVRVG
jgi:hypothetical protein